MPPPISPSSSRAQRKILVVDDVASVRYYHEYIMKKAGFCCENASGGHEALERLQAKSFDLLIVDILMPNLNGVELIEQINRNPRLAKLPILVISSEPFSESLRQAHTGPIGYVKKPISAATILEEISRLLDAT